MYQKILVLTTVLSIGILLWGCDNQSNQSNQLRIMSYNIKYDNPDAGRYAWKNRKDQLSNLIQFYEPAVIGTQEGLLHQLEYLEDELESYKWIGVGRDDGTMSSEFSALFYDSTKVELIPNTENTIWLSETPTKPSMGWDADFPRILTYGKFRDRSTGKSLWVFNTHFDHVGDTARTNSAKLIADSIASIANERPVILTGDFNAPPEREPYAVLTSDNRTLQDAFNASDLENVGPNFTFEGFDVRSDNDGRRIDYIFVNDKVDVQKHAIISSFRDFGYPSDHLPVVADIKLK
jgi:endonuclease/exonuclease/phosphatase family metal-dependent hydrolase